MTEVSLTRMALALVTPSGFVPLSHAGAAAGLDWACAVAASRTSPKARAHRGAIFTGLRASRAGAAVLTGND